MRRRLPSPALVVASVALFIAVAGAGVGAAAGLALVWSPKSNVLLAANVSSDGTVTGARVTGKRESLGVYTLTVRGDTFAPSASARHLRDKVEAVLRSEPGGHTVPSQCRVILGAKIAQDGGATAEVQCFTYDASVGDWQPADVAFDVQMLGP